MTEQRLKAILQELVDEDPFAVRPILQIVSVEFTAEVPTLAVTLERRPRLRVNLEFVNRHCRNDAEVRAVLCHELLHVILAHTERFERITPALHLALDAVINAIIHRQLGPASSAMMSRYYAKAMGVRRLLRPMNSRESAHHGSQLAAGAPTPGWIRAWHALYQGTLVVDDIEALAEQFGADGRDRLLGNHADLGRTVPDELHDAIERAMREMNGEGIWRAPKARGVGANAYDALFTAADAPLRKWERKALDVLKKHLEPDRKSRPVLDEPRESRLPVLTPNDRRAFVRAIEAPFLPDCRHATVAPRLAATAHVYLDVSGSMSAEMPLVIALLARLTRYIRRPFWAFSDEVAPAVIARGQLCAATTGGTSLACVLDHVERTRPSSAVIVTDGWIDMLDPAWVRRIAPTRLHAIVTRDGNPSALQRLGIPYTQLERLPS